MAHSALEGETLDGKLDGDKKSFPAPSLQKRFQKENQGDLEQSKGIIMVEIIEYVPNAVLSKTIIKKSTGNISIMSFDTGEGLTEKTSPFDTFAQIIDGKAEIVIDGVSKLLETGQGIILPAHLPNIFRANERFKMIMTVIKSGYE